MSRFLSSKIRLRGLSKNKIIVGCIFVGVILVIIVFMSSNNDNSKKSLYSSDSNNNEYKAQINKNNVDNIMNQIMDESNKQKAVPPIQSVNTKNVASGDVNAVDVPIVDPEEERFRKTQKTNMYASVNGKSLMFCFLENLK